MTCIIYLSVGKVPFDIFFQIPNRINQTSVASRIYPTEYLDRRNNHYGLWQKTSLMILELCTLKKVGSKKLHNFAYSVSYQPNYFQCL